MGRSALSPDRSPFVALGLAFVGLVALLWLPLSPRGLIGWDRTVGITLDCALLVAAMVAAQWIGGAWHQPGPRWASWRSWIVGSGFAVLVVYEMFRAGSRLATSEDLPLYDLLLLTKHLYVLGRDLYGGWATLAVVVALVTPVGIAVVGAGAAGRIEALARSLGPPRTAVLAVGVTVVVLVAGRLPRSRLLTPWLIRNLSDSVALYREVRTDIETRPHRAVEDVVLTRRPDVWLYIIESYGDVVRVRPDLAERWTGSVDALDEHLTARGWATASGTSTAPVHGGRSWIADASLLSGLHVDRQATYEHLVTLTDRLSHLPGYFADQGYATVLVRPKDRARPGVELVNHFGFTHTVFFDDLEYEGPVVGWGHIPDQYTIDFVHERVIEPLDVPTFAFFHLATAHIPWDAAPPILEPYTRWQKRKGREAPIYGERSAYSELRMRMARFKRRKRGKHQPDQGTPQDYLDNVIYDLEAIARQLEAGPRGDQVVIVMGDHQPPLLANDMPADVPVHVLASDEAWLQGFWDHGFEEGLRPERVGPARIEHRDLFAVLAEALVGAQSTP